MSLRADSVYGSNLKSLDTGVISFPMTIHPATRGVPHNKNCLNATHFLQYRLVSVELIFILERPVGTRPSLLEITVGPQVLLDVRSESETTT